MSHENRWIIEQDEATDRYLCSAFAFALDSLLAMPLEKASKILADPRPIHRSVYAALTPADHPEFAGNFRGSDFLALKESVVACSFNENEGTSWLTPPWDVEKFMTNYGNAVAKVSAVQPESLEHALGPYGLIMISFGLIHPFQDGNGHVQRLSFQYFMQRAGFRMASAWHIHPCPYGEEVHRALASGKAEALTPLLRPFVLA